MRGRIIRGVVVGGALLHISCRMWSHFSGRRTKREERCKRGSAVSLQGSFPNNSK